MLKKSSMQSTEEKKHTVEKRASEHILKEGGCSAACPKCITRSCALNNLHNGSHECSEGHHW